MGEDNNLTTKLWFGNPPIYALSANTMKDDEEQFLKAGATGFLAKPVNMQALQSILIKELK